MDPFSAFTSVVAVIELVGRVSISAASLMRDVKDARTDMIQVRKDLGGLSAVLKMVDEDLSLRNRRPDAAVDGIANNCLAVLSEIEAVLGEGRSRFAWAASRKERVDKLRARLNEYTLWLDVALGYSTRVVVHDIKSDTASILGKVDNIERYILRRTWAEITKPGMRTTVRMCPPAQTAPGVSHSRQPQQLPWQGPSGAPGTAIANATIAKAAGRTWCGWATCTSTNKSPRFATAAAGCGCRHHKDCQAHLVWVGYMHLNQQVTTVHNSRRRFRLSRQYLNLWASQEACEGFQEVVRMLDLVMEMEIGNVCKTRQEKFFHFGRRGEGKVTNSA
ncbi:hypothetical protein J7T55_007828 [Diaporthe amygdali]|uniref:uncharacterized protein n=1 Tax=Phomopsis amygdali TaxID=1214568 RepID=UPI0022FDD0AA|nr:uncharacterized protein J7T55_007828 [Diaporthe amygdali]KAJ0107637.1 hypothetical protein J7T55_007828 [Diaporthe amygdali]